MNDEFAAEHLDVRIGVVAVIKPALRGHILAAGGMEGVRRTVDANESFACGDRVKESLLSSRAHRRKPVGSHLGQVARRDKEEGVKLGQVGRVKEASVLGLHELDVVLGSELLENLEREAGHLAAGTRLVRLGRVLDDRMLVSRGLGEKKDALCRGRGRCSGVNPQQ